MNNVEVNSHGTNKAIKFNILNNDLMREAGFSFIDSLNKWFFSANLFRDISFSVSIPANGDEAWIDVIDEDFGQPYDYQYMLERNPDAEFPNKIKEKVEANMLFLKLRGIIEGHEYGQYI